MAEKNTGGVGRRKTPIVAKKTSTEMAGKIKKTPQAIACGVVAGVEGLEPSARGFGDRCSTN